jgi:hypothetical protein
MQNSQCNVFGGPTTVSGDGNTLTLTVTLTFSSSFAGNKNLYVRAADEAGPATDYDQLGTFTTTGASSAPDFSFGAQPNSATVTGKANGTFAIDVTRTNGYNGTVNFTASGLPPGASSDPIAPNTPNSGPSYFSFYTAGSTPTGSYTVTLTGTDGTLTHTSTITLNVTMAPTPTLSASPNTGSGASQTFTFTSTGTASARPNSMNVLFNTGVDGRAACWLYYDGSDRVSLASDDGSIWTTMGANKPSIGNSQCTLSGFAQTGNADNYELGFSVTITFSHAFAGAKNIFVRGDNSQGGDTGYALQGGWTVP